MVKGSTLPGVCWIVIVDQITFLSSMTALNVEQDHIL